jgi:hypothetical protein
MYSSFEVQKQFSHYGGSGLNLARFPSLATDLPLTHVRRAVLNQCYYPTTFDS